MQRATVVQLNYVVDHPIVDEQLIKKKLRVCNTFRDKRHLLILVLFILLRRNCLPVHVISRQVVGRAEETIT